MSDWELQSLLQQVYGQGDSEAAAKGLDALVEAVKKVPAATKAPVAAAKRLLGPESTKLTATVEVVQKQLSLGIYPHLHPEKDPLVRVTVTNGAGTIRRVQVRAKIEGFTAKAIRTIEIKSGSRAEFRLKPTLLPGVGALFQNAQWASLQVGVWDLDGKEELQDTYPVICLARDVAATERITKATDAEGINRYLAAWVTPYAPALQELIEEMAAETGVRKLIGYQLVDGKQVSVEPQVKAAFNVLKKRSLQYAHSVIAFGLPGSVRSQRVRLPRESLEARVANCLDGTVLMASLLEAVSLDPAIVLVPGHAFLGWRQTPGNGDWDFLETTAIADKTFEEARDWGRTLHQRWDRELQAVIYDVRKLRATDENGDPGIWPIE